MHRLEGGERPQFSASSVTGFPQVLEWAGRWLQDQVRELPWHLSAMFAQFADLFVALLRIPVAFIIAKELPHSV